MASIRSNDYSMKASETDKDSQRGAVGEAHKEAAFTSKKAASSIVDHAREAAVNVGEIASSSAQDIKHDIKEGTQNVKASLGKAVAGAGAATSDAVAENVEVWIVKAGELLDSTVALIKRHPMAALSVAGMVGALIFRRKL